MQFGTLYFSSSAMQLTNAFPFLQTGQEGWGADTSAHALCAKATWLDHVTLETERDLEQERELVRLRTENHVDELLRAQAAFLQVKDAEVRVQWASNFALALSGQGKRGREEANILVSGLMFSRF